MPVFSSLQAAKLRKWLCGAFGVDGNQAGTWSKKGVWPEAVTLGREGPETLPEP